MIQGNYRNLIKQFNYLKYKVQFLLLSHNHYLAENIHMDTIDWKETYDLIILKKEYTTLETNKEESKMRAYNIKNFLEELPTCSQLYRRYPNIFKNAICLRCGLFEEDWE